MIQRQEETVMEYEKILSYYEIQYVFLHVRIEHY